MHLSDCGPETSTTIVHSTLWWVQNTCLQPETVQSSREGVLYSLRPHACKCAGTISSCADHPAKVLSSRKEHGRQLAEWMTHSTLPTALDPNILKVHLARADVILTLKTCLPLPRAIFQTHVPHARHGRTLSLLQDLRLQYTLKTRKFVEDVASKDTRGAEGGARSADIPINSPDMPCYGLWLSPRVLHPCYCHCVHEDFLH